MSERARTEHEGEHSTNESMDDLDNNTATQDDTNNNNTNSSSHNNTNNNKPQKAQSPPKEYNPRWKGYVYMAILSLVNFASISNIPRSARSTSAWVASMTFGAATFALSILILLQDRSQTCLSSFQYTKASNGYFEGYVLMVCVLWWVGGVAYLTCVNGIAYVATNIYFTSWLCLASCIYTLNEWSASKDILSIAELTGLSATLKSWYVLFLSSLVVMGTCVDLTTRIGGGDSEDTVFGIALGVASTIVAVFFILVHYNFIPNVEEGGMLELSSSFLLILLWIIGLAILTRHEGVAATLSGSTCDNEQLFRQSGNFNTDNRDDENNNNDQQRASMFWRDPSCHIVLYYGEQNELVATIIDEKTNYIDLNAIRGIMPCSGLPRQVPGSNLYFAAWIAFAAAINIPFRWKAAQALQFAQAHQQQLRQKSYDGEDADDDDDDDYDDAI